MIRRLFVAAFTLVIASCVLFRPQPKRHQELRGVWIATVNNGDWPSRRDLAADEQKRELIAILDRVAALGLNAVFLQVRPMADALYASDLEPWSEFLTGTMGKAPEPLYDPLSFAIEEAHARGIELHAWFNPFRAHHPSATSPFAASHVVRRHPERVHNYGRYVWMDPGDGDVQRDVLAVMTDVVRRYDIDGIHIDDYFYPYPENGIDFPDQATWERYRAGGGRLTRPQWRRDNINRFVRDLYQAVKPIKPAVEVGISPFGIWRPGHPPQIRGLDAYDAIYADARLWLRRGWVDYLAPQLYWPIDKREQSFPVLLRWWTGQDWRGRGIVAGISINRVATGRPNSITADEIRRQLEIVKKERGAVGYILFSAKALMSDRGGVNGVVGTSTGSGSRKMN